MKDSEKKIDNNQKNSMPDFEFLEQHGTKKFVKKGTILQEAGIIATKGFYVKSGLLRSYAIDDNGKIHIFMFAPEGWVISDIESHTIIKPADLFIDAFEDSEIIEINFKKLNFEDIVLKSSVNKLFRRIAKLQRRVIMLLSYSARQRYEDFLATYPQILNRVPQKLIASYLGITPEALSNIKSKLK